MLSKVNTWKSGTTEGADQARRTRCLLKVVTCFMVTVLVNPGLVYAQSGGDSGSFLRLGIGIRALSMGGAFTSLADDAAAVYWNPAGMGMLHATRRRGSLMYRSMSLDRRQVAISYTQHLSENGGGVGFALIHLGVDNIDGRNINGQRTGSLSDSENAILLSFSPDIHARISVGLTMKLLVYRLGGQSAKGFGGDIGFIARPIDPLSVGFIFRDVGTRITWDTAGLFSRNVQRSETLPRSFTIGASYRFWQERMTVAVDIESAQRRDSEVHIGAEFNLPGQFAARTGLRGGQFTAGTGFVTSYRSTSVRLNYVFLNDRIGAGDTHAIEWEVGF